MRILDRLLAGEHVDLIRHSVPPPSEAIRVAQPLQIDNVAEYMFRDVKIGDGWDLNVDFPNIAPPFEWAWYEYKRPASIKSLQHFGPNSSAGEIGLPDMVGVLVEGQRVDDGWIARFYCYSSVGKQPVRGPIVFQVAVDAEGRGDGERGLAVLLAGGDDAFSRLLWAAGADLLVPVLMATSLLHAKNVTMEREPPADPKLLRSHRKRHGAERTRFHLLHIEPMRRVLRDAGAESEGTGFTKAMHLVRGHFGDYREGRGLFGKYRGIYWWDQHVRGDPAEGLVKKAYVVHGPK